MGDGSSRLSDTDLNPHGNPAPPPPAVVGHCTTNSRGWLSEVDVNGFGVARTHLPTTISVDRIVDSTDVNVGPVKLRQIRELIADLLGL